ncbi:MAG: hypothetical protein ACFFBD_08455, partial [Candidatus Hodarchaeota archaeon]
MSFVLDNFKKWFSDLELLSSEAQRALKNVENDHNMIITQTKQLREKKNTLQNELESRKSKILDLRHSIGRFQQEIQEQLTSINKQIETNELAIKTLQG